ncbi:hypothetical protein BDV26DRAFT_282455 [Aspergillus bertholletiae]|uniref:LIM zinc-binding domain-containing protein n=1 Tax=Aspergillus bertholletiae TaxID=1226010 RepID=A0A5N7B3Q8_9EURO|nr:hypothetical protein BDV26DRAFT_282455 [Aspergillus bertholletiae]
MAATMSMGLLPTIKCSNCGMDVEISVMGDHICAPMSASASPPPPPPKHHSPSKSIGRSGIPPPIDPSKANRPFMHLEAVISSKGNITPFPGGQQSPPRQLLRSQTSPLPSQPDQDDIPTFPLPRSMSQKMSKHMVPLENPYQALPLPAGDTGTTGQSIRLPLGEQAVAPPPLPKDNTTGPLPSSHKYSYSTESKSTYRTSVASSRYDSRRSTSVSIGRPSYGSMSNQYKFLDDAPPVPSTFPSKLLRDSTATTFSEDNPPHGETNHDQEKRPGSGNLNPSTGRASNKVDDQENRPAALRASSHTNSDRLSSNRGSAELFFRSPTLSSHGTPSELLDLPQEGSTSPGDTQDIEYKAYRSPGLPHLQPPGQESGDSDGLMAAQRKNSDAVSEAGISITNFARELGLDMTDSATESSTTSSHSSRSDTRSGTSFSSIGSDSSGSRRNPSDQGQLGTLVEDLKKENGENTTLEMTDLETLEPPRMPPHFFSPDSPTDPAISMGSVSLIRDKPMQKPAKEDQPEPPAPTSPTTERPVRGAPRPKGPCRGCGEMIIGKSVSSADGRLTGRYHRACFVCYDCKTPFQTADFYVMDDLPYCAQHYHQRNNSLCHTCHTGIEGQYLETIERRGQGPADRVKFHPDCLTCRTCQVALKGDYFEWNGQVYCERDARRAAALPPPPRFQRPGPGPGPGPGLYPPAPLPHSRQPSRGYPRPPPAGYAGPRSPRPGPAGPPGPPGPPTTRLPPPSAMDGPYNMNPDGGRRFPERRTTRLMMI